jgi:hypothetical protein
MDQRFVVAANVHARRFDEETVILHLDAGQYFSLDAVGTHVWQELEKGSSLAEAVESVMGEYDVDEDTARNDVRRLAGELIAEGILRRA